MRLQIRSGRVIVHDKPNLSMGIENRALIFSVLSVTNREHGTGLMPNPKFCTLLTTLACAPGRQGRYFRGGFSRPFATSSRFSGYVNPYQPGIARNRNPTPPTSNRAPATPTRDPSPASNPPH